MQRDLYIDVVKGFATLSIIFIHTVFWSGQLYVPTEVRNLSLLFDVPMFFFLSGLTSSGKVEKNIHRLLKLQISYMIFITMLFILYCIFNQNLKWEKLFDWYLHVYSESNPIYVSIGSMWYMKIYFIVAFIGVLVLRYLTDKQIYMLSIILFAGILSFSFYYYPPGTTGYIFVYLLLFLIAKLCRKTFIKTPYIFLGFFVLLAIYYLLYLYFGDKATILVRRQKFPPNIIYLAYSSFSLFLILVFKGRLKFEKPNFLTYIGQNAIFYYFAQGLSSSLLYLLVNEFHKKTEWY
ncbi:MAG: acyltransferase family protein, partial [Prevotellaceae bacterium]|nr:acyltransferase family protein [Prevotellaceae bacterium]